MWSTVGTFQDGVHVLMEAVPHGLDTDKLTARLQAIEHVLNVHDVHVWVTSGTNRNLWAHMLVEQGTNTTPVIHAAQRIARSVGCHHTCFQVEDAGTYDPAVEGPGCFHKGCA